MYLGVQRALIARGFSSSRQAQRVTERGRACPHPSSSAPAAALRLRAPAWRDSPTPLPRLYLCPPSPSRAMYLLPRCACTCCVPLLFGSFSCLSHTYCAACAASAAAVAAAAVVAVVAVVVAAVVAVLMLVTAAVTAAAALLRLWWGCCWYFWYFCYQILPDFLYAVNKCTRL